MVTKQVLDKPLEIFYHLSNLKLKGGFDIHPVLVYDDAAQESLDTAITQEEYADFLGVVFKEWWEHRDRYQHIDPFDTYLKHYTSDYDCLGCCDSPTCGLHLYLGPDGETAQCGRAADWDILLYGNLKDKSLKEIFSDAQRAMIDNRVNVLPKTDCKDVNIGVYVTVGVRWTHIMDIRTSTVKQTNACQGRFSLRNILSPLPV